MVQFSLSYTLIKGPKCYAGPDKYSGIEGILVYSLKIVAIITLVK